MLKTPEPGGYLIPGRWTGVTKPLGQDVRRQLVETTVAVNLVHQTWRKIKWSELTAEYYDKDAMTVSNGVAKAKSLWAVYRREVQTQVDKLLIAAQAARKEAPTAARQLDRLMSDAGDLWDVCAKPFDDSDFTALYKKLEAAGKKGEAGKDDARGKIDIKIFHPQAEAVAKSVQIVIGLMRDVYHTGGEAEAILDAYRAGIRKDTKKSAANLRKLAATLKAKIPQITKAVAGVRSGLTFLKDAANSDDTILGEITQGFDRCADLLGHSKAIDAYSKELLKAATVIEAGGTEKLKIRDLDRGAIQRDTNALTRLALLWRKQK